ncbi:MAG TPA: uracil-DNA glycosylase [Planctomycetota bacterium]|nr:uracil-DNA glycosylase [Planctomycetota bacterium]
MDAPSRGEIARALRERLEVNRLFGWTVPVSRERLRSGAPARPDPLPPPGEGPPRAAVEASGSPSHPPAAEARPPRGGPGPEERARRESLLSPVREEVAGCTRCTLCHSRTRTVFGTGDPAARIFFVGEAPGFDEDRQGEPFVGKAGQLLNDIIKAMGLERREVYIANVVKCRPPQNRVPDLAEMGSCRGYLERQIEIIAPEVLVLLGAVAAKAILGTTLAVGRLRGRFHDYRGIPVMPTYHPAYLLRNPHDKRKVWEDVQQVMARLGLPRR